MSPAYDRAIAATAVVTTQYPGGDRYETVVEVHALPGNSLSVEEVWAAAVNAVLTDGGRIVQSLRGIGTSEGEPTYSVRIVAWEYEPAPIPLPEE